MSIETANKEFSRAELIGLYNEGILTDFLRGLSKKELDEAKSLIEADEIHRGEEIILDAITTEKEYIGMNPILSTRNLTIENSKVKTNYEAVAATISQDEAKFTVDYLLGLDINPEEVLTRCPMMLSIENFSKAYGFLTENGWSEEQVEYMLVTDTKAHEISVELLNAIKKKGNTIPSTLTDDRFKTFVRKVANSFDKKQNKATK